MLNMVTTIKDFVDEDECIGCEYGEHVNVLFFTDYASPIDIARMMNGDISVDMDILDQSFANLNTQHFVDFLKTIPEDERDNRSDYLQLAKAY